MWFLNYNELLKEIKQTENFRLWEKCLKDRRAKTIIASRIFRVSYGLMGDVEPVGEGVFELRIHYGPGYRLYFKNHREEIILLLCGGDKSSQKRDICLAKNLAKSWSNGND